jgi:hypothetical protein
MVLGVFGLTAIVLAAVGMYGELRTSSAARVREFALRKALGAKPNEVSSMVQREAGVLHICDERRRDMGTTTGTASAQSSRWGELSTLPFKESPPAPMLPARELRSAATSSTSGSNW